MEGGLLVSIRTWLRKSRTRTWLVVALLFVLLLLLSSWWFGPAPPRMIRLATGHPDGGYAALGKAYEEQLKKMGLKVEVVYTQGSVDNLQRLLRGEVDVALVQGGIYQEKKREIDPQGTLRGLAAVDLEPLLVFYRKSAIKDPSLSDCEGLKVCIGANLSGTDALARVLLEKHGISKRNATLVNANLEEEAQRLKDKEVGGVAVGFFVISARNPTVKELLQVEQLQLMSFDRRAAYALNFPYLIQVTLPQGVIDLQRNLPREDKHLLAPATLLASRENLHPRVVEQILEAARTVHPGANLLEPRISFPSQEGMDLPMHPAATRYLESGESLLARLVPYSITRYFHSAQILLLPLLTLLLPYLRIFPLLYRFRVNRLLRAHYRALRELEEKIEQTTDPEELHQRLRELDHLRKEMEDVSRKVPGHLQREVYHWRLHVIMVRNEVLARKRALESGLTPDASSLIERSIHALECESPHGAERGAGSAAGPGSIPPGGQAGGAPG
jgi:uncharacterized protein